MPREVRLVGEARSRRDVGKLRTASLDQVTGAVEPPREQEPMRRFAERLLERAREMSGREPGLTRQRVDAQPLVELRLDQLEDATARAR